MKSEVIVFDRGIFLRERSSRRNISRSIHLGFRSLCEFVGDCFGPRYFSSGAALPQKNNTSAQNNHLRFSHNDLKKDGAQLLLSK